MNWKRLTFAVMLLSVTVFGMAGCGNTEETESVVGDSSTDEEATPMPPEGGMPGGRGMYRDMDLAAAAEALGITEEELSEAMGDMQQGWWDIYCCQI